MITFMILHYDIVYTKTFNNIECSVKKTFFFKLIELLLVLLTSTSTFPFSLVKRNY